jgi:hypothetical protein
MKNLEALKVGGVKKKEKRKNKRIVGSKASFSSCYFLKYSFSFALQT